MAHVRAVNTILFCCILADTGGQGGPAVLSVIQRVERYRTLFKHGLSRPPRSIETGRTNRFGFAPAEYRLRREDVASR
jgi:hypothetical protein